MYIIVNCVFVLSMFRFKRRKVESCARHLYEGKKLNLSEKLNYVRENERVALKLKGNKMRS